MLAWKKLSCLHKAYIPILNTPRTAQRGRNRETEKQLAQVKSQVAAKSLPKIEHLPNRIPRYHSSNFAMSRPNVTDKEADTSRTPAPVSTENALDKDQNDNASEVGDGRLSSPMTIRYVLNVDQDSATQETLSDAEDDVPRKRLCMHCKVSVPANLWDAHVENAMHQQKIPATDSNRLPPVGIVMPNLSLMVSPDRRKRAPPPSQQKRTPTMGIVMPDLSLNVSANQQNSAKVATDADEKSPATEVTGNPITGYDLSSVDNDVFDAAVALLAISRSDGDRKEW